MSQTWLIELCIFSLKFIVYPSFFFKYLVISIVLGVIGVGGLVFQWGSGIIDEFFSTFDDLEARINALEGATTTGTATTACTCDLTAVTATANAACAKVKPNIKKGKHLKWFLSKSSL